MTKTPEDALETLESLPKYEVKPGLERIKFLLRKLGNPDEAYPVVHVAGSNGKGSVNTILYTVLKENYRVGQFLSPPLVEFGDRIKVDGRNIEGDAIVAGVNSLEGPLAELRDKGEEPSLFEAITALAAWYFEKEEIDIGLLETGLGGRYDATNPVGRPLLSIVTSVDLEHGNLLGDSIDEIASEIAGIAKRNKPLILGPSENLPEEVFRSESETKGCNLIRAEDETSVELRDFDWTYSRFLLQRTSIKGLECQSIKFGLAGTFQERNLTTGLTALAELADQGFPVDPEDIKTGLAGAKWPGRFQLMDKHPHLLVDGAHNSAAIKLLVQEINRYKLLLPEEGNVKLVFSGLKDKNLKEMLSNLKPVVNEVYLAELDNPRAASRGLLEKLATELNLDYRPVGPPNYALELARTEAEPEDLILVTGSLYLVREAIKRET